MTTRRMDGAVQVRGVPAPLRARAGLLAAAVLGAACAGGEAPPGSQPREGPEDPSDPEVQTRGAPDDFSEGLLPVNGTELFVKTMGSGPPVLVVHGGPLLDHGYLLPYLAPLGDDRTLVFFDQRLSGRSAGHVDSTSVSVEAFVADMEVLRQTLGLERITLLAHSWGGFLALHYGLQYPDRLASLVLVSPTAPSASLQREEQARLLEDVPPAHSQEARRLREAPGVATGEPEAIEALLRHAFRLQFHDPESADRLSIYVPPDYLERSRQLGVMGPELAGFDLQEQLEGFGVPTLLVYGAEEPGVDVGGEALIRSLEDVRLVRIRDAGHFAFMEQPEAFLREIRRFLEGR